MGAIPAFASDERVGGTYITEIVLRQVVRADGSSGILKVQTQYIIRTTGDGS